MQSIGTYAWHTDSLDDEETVIRIYGMTEDGENVCVKVNDFTPYAYLELPDIPGVNWERHAKNLGRAVDEICGNLCPCVKKKLVRRKRLYYAYTTMDTQASTGPDNVQRKEFYYLFCSFTSETFRKNFGWKFGRPITVPGIRDKVHLRVHETNASAQLQLCTLRELLTAGWMEFPTNRRIAPERQETICDQEYSVSWKQLNPHTNEHTPGLLVMSWDIEVYSSIPSAMPKASRPADIVFQMSCVLWRMGTPVGEYHKYILTLGEPCADLLEQENITVLTYPTEADLLLGYAEFVRTHKPNIVIGYNIFGFDVEYMLERAKFRYIDADFRRHGFHKMPAAEKEISWSSSAYQNQKFVFVNTEGILYIDLLPVIKRDYKLSRYSLNFVSEHFLGAQKDPLSPQGIFKCWDMWVERHPKGAEALSVVSKYCVQDSVLVLQLFQKLQVWVGLQEMANVTRVPVLDLYTRGQGIKTFSQMYHKCTHLGIVTEKDGYVASATEKFQGAYVFPPMAGIHEYVVPFDFKSLYPSGIIAMNICSSTFIDDTKAWGRAIPDSMCNVIDWESHEYCGCPKDTRVGESRPTSARVWCNHFRYRFLKQTILKGILPDTVEKLLDARARVRKVDIALRKRKIAVIKAVLKGQDLDDDQLDFYEANFSEEFFDQSDELLHREIDTLEKEIEVLDKRQLALKVSANSMYGGMGASKGYLSFLPGAMSTTAYGRQSIELAKKTLREQYGGVVVYGDTDSCYVKFSREAIQRIIELAGLNSDEFDKLVPEFEDDPTGQNPLPNELWAACEWLEVQISKLYPKPMFLEFEGEIYRRILFLTKKRYMAIQCTSSGEIVMKKNPDGVLKPKMTMKGVLLTRRDNSNFVRDVYGSSIYLMFDCVGFEGILANILDWYDKLVTRRVAADKFVVTQSVNELSEYKIRTLTTDKAKRRKRLVELDLPYYECMCGDAMACRGCEAYRYKCLPAQAQLAEKMRSRGNIVAAGTRLPYVILQTNGGIKAKKSQKIEDYDYYRRFSSVLRIDYLHYIEATVKQLDDALRVVFGKVDVLKAHHKLRVAKWKICQQIQQSGAPPVELASESEE